MATDSWEALADKAQMSCWWVGDSLAPHGEQDPIGTLVVVSPGPGSDWKPCIVGVPVQHIYYRPRVCPRHEQMGSITMGLADTYEEGTHCTGDRAQRMIPEQPQEGGDQDLRGQGIPSPPGQVVTAWIEAQGLSLPVCSEVVTCEPFVWRGRKSLGPWVRNSWKGNGVGM